MRQESLSVHRPDWKALLIGGPSGVGKTLVAERIGLQFGIPWLQVDDLRLALVRSRVELPGGNASLYLFESADVWKKRPQQLRDALIALGEVMSPAIEVVIENHIDTNSPIIIEGDSILPSLLARPAIRERAMNGQIRAVFLVEPDESVLLNNMLARGRGMEARTETEQRTEARTKWLYGQWLAHEAHHHSLPVLEPRPWSTLIERILVAMDMYLPHSLPSSH